MEQIFGSIEIEIGFHPEPDEQMTNQYCQDENIDIIFEVPDDRRIAEAYSVGKMIIDVLPDYKKDFEGLYESVSKRLEG